MPTSKSSTFYAVHYGRTPGVYLSWPECQAEVKGISNATYKKFSTRNEAETFVRHGYNKTLKRSYPSTIYTIPTPTKESSSVALWPFAPPFDFVPNHTVYTDGGYRRVTVAGTKKTSKIASIGVFFGKHDPRNISVRVGTQHIGKHTKQTNNVGELCAILEALRVLDVEIFIKDERILIGTDSQYAIRCATTYGAKCAPGGIKANYTNIPNRELVLALHKKVLAAEGRIQFLYIPAHTSGDDEHTIGNRAADALATKALIGEN